MSERLSSDERARYAREGFLVRGSPFAPQQLDALRDAVERVHERVREASGGPGTHRYRVDDRAYERVCGSVVKWEQEAGAELRAIRSMEPFAHLEPRLAALLADPRLCERTAELLALRSVSIFTDKLNFKRPGGSAFPWHQDAPYWAFGCAHLDRLVSVQVYLDDATRENGCLWMIPGSHARGFLPTFRDRGALGRLHTDLRGLDLADPVAIEAPAGSLVFFDGHVVHGSRRNRTRASRRAVVLTYQPPGLPRWSPPDDVLAPPAG
jgi:hypothetical protein